MSRNLRKYIWFVLSFVMVIVMSMSVLAEEQGQSSATGTGRIEEIEKPDIYQVILPTDVNGIFDFIFDPQHLIEETDAAAYGGLDFEKGATVFFRRLDGETTEAYNSSSDHIKIINRSNIPVDIVVDVSISPESLGGIALTEDREFNDDTDTSLYMALTDGKNTAPVGKEGAHIRATIPAASEDAFEYSYDQESGKYTYGLKRNLEGIQFPEYSFQLTGAVNERGDWSTVKNTSPLITVTWQVTPGENEDSDEEQDPEQDEVSDPNAVLSQTLETVPVEDEVEAGEKNGTADKEETDKKNGTADKEETMDEESDVDSEP